MMKLATWNVNSLKVRLPQVLDWLAANPVEVLCLQETKLQEVLEKQISPEKRSRLQYIDVRFGNQAYVK